MTIFKKALKCQVIFISLILLGIACNSIEEQEEILPEDPCLTEAELNQFKPITVEQAQVLRKIRLSGKVTNNPNSLIHYVSPYSGTITRTYISIGDKVRKGQVLAEVQSSELNSMIAESQQLESQLHSARRELEAVESFHQDELASERELLAAQTQKQSLKTELQNLQNNLRLFSSQDENGMFRILAPQSGYIVENRMVSGMRFSTESDPLFTVSDLDQVWVNLNVYATEINLIKTGMPVHLKTSSYPDKIFDAKITHISSVIDPGDNVLKARAILDNNELFLKPGLHIEAIVEKETEEQAIRLPASAVVFHNNRNYAVYVDDCITRYTPLEILYEDEESAYVKNGLQPGDQVISENVLLQFQEAYTRGRIK